MGAGLSCLTIKWLGRIFIIVSKSCHTFCGINAIIPLSPAGVVHDLRGGEQALRRRAAAHARAGQDVVRELQEEVQDARARHTGTEIQEMIHFHNIVPISPKTR